MYQEGRSIQEFAFLNKHSGRYDATIMFGAILRILYNHPDWSQIHTFCTKRYSKANVFEASSARKLVPQDNSFVLDRNGSVTADFNTDPSTIGLPKDFVKQLGAAAVKSYAAIMGPDPLNCSIGPAISVGIGAGAYMDLLYAGNPPGTYPAKKSSTSTAATTKKGGRDRTLQEWQDIWAAIGDWVYEYDSTMIMHGLGGVYSYKFSDEESQLDYFGKCPRKYLQTDAIRCADAIRDVFGQLCENPVKFHGLEWDFLTLEVNEAVEAAFLKRFGQRQKDAAKNLEDLLRDVDVGNRSWNRLNYNGVSPVHLKPCLETYNGIDWERWLLSIEGGDVVVVKTVFQVRIPACI